MTGLPTLAQNLAANGPALPAFGVFSLRVMFQFAVFGSLLAVVSNRSTRSVFAGMQMATVSGTRSYFANFDG